MVFPPALQRRRKSGKEYAGMEYLVVFSYPNRG